MSDMKVCAVCKTSKEIGDFPPHFGTADGHMKVCKPCHAAAQKAGRTKATEGSLEEKPKKTAARRAKCLSCGEIKGGKQFNRDNARRNGLRGRCRICENAKVTELRVAKKVVRTPARRKDIAHANEALAMAMATTPNTKTLSVPLSAAVEMGLMPEVSTLYRQAKAKGIYLVSLNLETDELIVKQEVGV